MNTTSASQVRTTPFVQQVVLTLLRIAIGWHFLFEGLAKFRTPGWTSAEYLDASRFWFAEGFQAIAASPTLLWIADTSVVWGLMGLGVALMLGLCTRWVSVMAAGLIALFYLCNPPITGLGPIMPSEGSYLIVNKNLIELVALLALAVSPRDAVAGIDRLIWKPASAVRIDDSSGVIVKEELTPQRSQRRDWLVGLAGIPFAGAFGTAYAKDQQWKSYEDKNLVDANARASSKSVHFHSLAQLEGTIPRAKIKDVPFSRMILGGNLLSGWAHSRDLIYVSELVKAYHTKDRIFSTLLLAEKCGINTLLTNTILCTIMDEYWKRGIGKMQFISDCAGLSWEGGKHAMPFDQYMDVIRRALDYGTCACYIQGETADHYIANGHIHELHKALELMKAGGVPAGIGAHRIETVKACVDIGLEPDFWMKTLHHHGYWSAQHSEWNDNIYCYNPDETISYMQSLPQPWIAFKVLAAGAIKPENGFTYAFENGADFICVGMYDFQMVKNVNIALDVLNRDLRRERPWVAETI